MSEMALSVPTLLTISTKRAAIMICNTQSVKKEILCRPGSNYFLSTRPFLNSEVHWKAMISSDVISVLHKLGLPEGVQQKVTSCCLLVAREMMKCWQKLTYGFAIEPTYCAEVINPRLFTWEGRIDKRRAAEELVKDERVPVDRRFNIACSYMLIDDIGLTWKQLTSYERTSIQSDSPFPSLIKLWACNLSRGPRGLLGSGDEGFFWKTALEIAVAVESDVAVQYCWHMLEPSVRDGIVARLAEDLLNPYDLDPVFSEGANPFPVSYLHGITADIFCFLYTQMTEEQRRNFLVEGFRMQEYDRIKLLKFFIDYDCHDIFLYFARVVWQTSPERFHSKCLSSILCYISLKYFTSYGHDPCPAYQSLAQKFWNQSPDSAKRTFFESKEGFQSCITDLDKDISRFLLKDATGEETVKLFFSTKERPGLIFRIFELHGMNLADYYLQHSVLNQCQKQHYLKLEIELFPFKWDNLETLDRFYNFMHYCLQFEDEVLKEKLIKMYECQRRDDICMALILAGKWEDVDRLLRQSFSSPEDIVAFKKALFEKSGCDIHYYYCRMDRKLELKRCAMWFQLSPDEIKKLKKECFSNHHLTVESFWALFQKVDKEEITFSMYPFYSKKQAIYNFLEWHLSDPGQAIAFSEELKQCDNNFAYNVDRHRYDRFNGMDLDAFQQLIRLLIN